MVKFDATRDYYGDLELAPTADLKDIKSQFRKLALKYHPDRNPGHEAEVNAKFQTISSAHEVLIDTELRRKYDATRPRSRYPTSSGVKGNPWQNVSTQFPPPPRRTTFSRQQATSSARYTNFPSTVPPTAKKPTDDEKMKRSNYEAFESMRPPRRGHAESQSKPKPDPKTPKAADFQPGAGVPRTPSQQQRAEASFGTRKSGFGPRAMVGDEPPAANKNYASSRHTTNMFAESAASARRRRQSSGADPHASHRDSAYVDTRMSTPYSTHGGERLNPFEGASVNRSKSTRERGQSSPSTDDSSPTSRHRSSSVPRSSKAAESGPGLQVPDEKERPQSARETTNAGGSFASRAKDRYTPGSTNGASSSGGQSDQTSSDTGGSAKPTGGPTVFTFPLNDETFTRTAPEHSTFTRSSADDINTRFVNDNGSNQWKFNAGGLNDAASRQRAHSSSRAEPQSPMRRPTMRRADELGGQPSHAGATNGGFDAEGWSQKIGPLNFAPIPPNIVSSSPTRGGRRDSRKAKPVKPTMGNAGLVGDDSSSDETLFRGRPVFAEPVSANSPNAMDIDTPPPETARPKSPSPPTTNGPRKIHVEPSRREWRAGLVNGMKEDEPKKAVDITPITISKPVAMGSEDTEEFRVSLAGLKNVAPLAQPAMGLDSFGQGSFGQGSFGELKANLPFKSQAAAKVPIEKPHIKTEVEFPKPPMAPRPPQSLMIPGAKTSDRSWNRYVNDWQTYIRCWDEFDAQVTDHFSTRKTELVRERVTKGYSFLGAKADTGCNEYLDIVHQDNEVRNKWAIVCREHEQRVREFMAYRAAMMK